MQYSDVTEWFSSVGEEISIDDICKIILETDCDIYVGADSNPSKIPFVLAVSIAIIKKNKFSKYYYVKLKPWKDKKPGLQKRLYDEVLIACFVALKIRNRFPAKKIIVHADINPDFKTASGKYAKQLKNIIMAYGFDAIIKPESWAASSIADKHAY